jgi:hypothetical protein
VAESLGGRAAGTRPANSSDDQLARQLLTTPGFHAHIPRLLGRPGRDVTFIKPLAA